MSAVKKVSLKKLSEFNTVWHEDTSLVFKSAKEIIVVGKLVNKKIVPLTDADITTCEKFKFKYEITAEEEEEEVEETEEVEEEEVEETEEVEEEEVEETEEVEEEEVEVTEEKKEEVKVEAVKEEVKEEIKAEEEVKVEVLKEEVKKEIKAEVVKEEVKVKAEVETEKQVDDDATEFLKTVNDLNRIWVTKNEKNSKKIQSLEIELENTKKQYSDLQDLYEKMKIKFDGIKQLFSL